MPVATTTTTTMSTTIITTKERRRKHFRKCNWNPLNNKIYLLFIMITLGHCFCIYVEAGHDLSGNYTEPLSATPLIYVCLTPSKKGKRKWKS